MTSQHESGASPERSHAGTGSLYLSVARKTSLVYVYIYPLRAERFQDQEVPKCLQRLMRLVTEL